MRYPCDDVQIDPHALVTIGHALMDRVQSVYKKAGVHLPPRQVWSLGDGVFDCEELVVSFHSLAEGLINSETQVPNPCYIPVNAVFKVTVVRCAPVMDQYGNPPTPEQIGTATDLSVIDAYLLMKSACNFDMYGADVAELHPSALGGMGVDASVEVEEAQGGFQAVTLTVTTVIG
jgi:hypothetical protein